MAELTSDRIPPSSGWFEVIKNKDGSISVMPSQGFFRYIVGQLGGVRNVNSGVAQAQATADAAAAAAEAANQTAQATQSNAFSVTVDVASATAISDSFGPQTTNTVTVTATGGTAPYTYAWSKVSGDTVTINSPAAATTDFSATPFDETFSGQYRCLVTDAVLATASIIVGVSITHFTLQL